MHLLERLLLYAVSVTSITLLLKSDAKPEAPASEPTAHIENRENPNTPHPSLPKAEEPKPVPSPEPPTKTPSEDNLAPTPEMAPKAFVLHDDLGHSRIEIKLGSQGEPHILLKDAKGLEIIALMVDENGAGQIRLNHQDRHVVIGPEASGDLAVMLEGDQAEEIRLTLAADGEARILTKGRSPSTLAMSSRPDGAADIQIHRGEGTGGPLMSVDPQGEAAIGIASDQRQYGPVMHLFEDGLGQMTINGPDSDSGPTLLRTSDGTSVISVRHPNGQPAASLVSSSSGVSVIAVTNSQGTQQASMRTDKTGKVDIGVTEEDPSEPPPVKPQPPPKPPKVPEIELIRHVPNRPGSKPNLSTSLAIAR